MHTDCLLSNKRYQKLKANFSLKRRVAHSILNYLDRYSRFIYPPEKDKLQFQLAQLQKEANELQHLMRKHEERSTKLWMLEYQRKKSHQNKINETHRVSDFYNVFVILGGAPGQGKNRKH